MDISQIVQEAGMSDRPGFYSGRGATLSDLDSKIIGKIHDGILHEFGEQAAKEYIQLVGELEVMSATAFLNSLYKLSSNAWQFEPHIVNTSGVSPDSEGSAWGSLLSGLTRGDRDDSFQIKAAFLFDKNVRIRGNRSHYRR